MDDTIDLNRYCDGKPDRCPARRMGRPPDRPDPLRVARTARTIHGDLTKPRELYEGTWSFDAIAVVSKETLKKAGIRRHQRALTELEGSYTTTPPGTTATSVVEDRFGEIVESVCDIYELD